MAKTSHLKSKRDSFRWKHNKPFKDLIEIKGQFTMVCKGTLKVAVKRIQLRNIQNGGKEEMALKKLKSPKRR